VIDLKRFSERFGIKAPKEEFQVNSMDDDLRNSLWNEFTLNFYEPDKEIFLGVARVLWTKFFKYRLDELSVRILYQTYDKIKSEFFKLDWDEVYDFIEFIANINYLKAQNRINNFVVNCNDILKEELSVYRFIDKVLTKITSEEEISEIEEALSIEEPFSIVAHHLNDSLKFLSDRKSPNYRNSIKESISAVESIVQLITGEKKSTLGQALKKIEPELHPALKGAFEKLYGYTSNAEGIRHALIKEPNLDFEEAKFMLVSCSAFINYLKIKMNKAGLSI